MEEDIKEREREIAEQYEKDIEDTIRESVGLSSLSSFESYFSFSFFNILLHLFNYFNIFNIIPKF